MSSSTIKDDKINKYDYLSFEKLVENFYIDPINNRINEYTILSILRECLKKRDIKFILKN